MIGAVAGTSAAAVITTIVAPYKPRLHFDRAAAREYLNFSWPLFVSNLSRLVLIQASVFVGEWQLGLAGAYMRASPAMPSAWRCRPSPSS